MPTLAAAALAGASALLLLSAPTHAALAPVPAREPDLDLLARMEALLEARLAEQREFYELRLSELAESLSDRRHHDDDDGETHHHAHHPVRRLGDKTVSYSGLDIKRSNAGIRMGVDLDVQLQRTGDGELTLAADNVSVTGSLWVPEPESGDWFSVGAYAVDADGRIAALENADADGRLASLEDIGAGDRLADLEDADADGRLASLEALDVDDRISTLEDADADGRLTTLEAVKAADRLTALEGIDGEDRLDALEGIKATERLTALEAIDGEDRLDALEVVDADARITALEDVHAEERLPVVEAASVLTMVASEFSAVAYSGVRSGPWCLGAGMLCVPACRLAAGLWLLRAAAAARRHYRCCKLGSATSRRPHVCMRFVCVFGVCLVCVCVRVRAHVCVCVHCGCSCVCVCRGRSVRARAPRVSTCHTETPCQRAPSPPKRPGCAYMCVVLYLFVYPLPFEGSTLVVLEPLAAQEALAT